MTKVHRLMALARAHGAGWPDINQSLAQMQQAVLAQGTGFWDMTNQMGMGDPQIMRDRLQGLINADRADNTDSTPGR